MWAIGLSLGGTTGYAINPARDFGPRVAHAFWPVAGKGSSDWAYAPIPVAGPLLGAALAAVIVKAAQSHREYFDAANTDEVADARQFANVTRTQRLSDARQMVPAVTSAWSSMTNCAVIGAPKLNRNGAALSSCSSVSARTDSAAARLFSRRSSKRGFLRHCTLFLGVLCVQFGDNLPANIADGVASGDGFRYLNFNGVHGSHMVNDDADRTVVRVRHR